MRDKNKILGALYGQAIGDSMGMPTELWPIQKFGISLAGILQPFRWYRR